MLFENALIFLFSNRCLICEKRNVDILCDGCFRKLKKLEKLSIINFQNKNLNSLIYFYKYEKIIRKLVLQFKFFNKPYFSKIFSKIILKNEKICRKIKFYDIILSVPMHKSKQKIRGYNQSELIAKQIADNLNIKYYNDVLIKIKNTKMQSKLNGKERAENIKDVFYVEDFYKIKNKRIVLIDDIYTTGATLEECARVLKNAGVSEVCGIVIAKD